MKNNNPKSQAKAAKKAAANDIEASLVTALKQAVIKTGQNAEKLLKEIEKGSKKLAKKLSKEFVFDIPAKEKVVKTVKVTEVKKAEPVTKSKVVTAAAPKTPAKPAVVVAKDEAKPVAVTPKAEVKPVVVAPKAPAKPVTASKPTVPNNKPVKKAADKPAGKSK